MAIEPTASVAIPRPLESKARAQIQYYFWLPLAYLIFGIVGLLTSVIGLGLSFLLPAHIGRPVGQRMIQRLFAFFVFYLEQTKLASFSFHDLARLRDWRGGIIVANHPCLMDIVFLVSRLPKVFCLMKGGIRSNLILSGTARLAGYVDNRSARHMIAECTARIQAGETLVIFPEGSRTIQPGVNPFKMGFALVAQLANAPIQTVFIEAGSSFLGKRWPFHKPPDSLPLLYSLRPGECFTPGGSDPKALGKTVEDYFRAHLGRG